MPKLQNPTEKKQPRRRGCRSGDGSPSPIDIHVGTRVRLRRTLLGMSQEQLGAAIGLTFQQVQKYERGMNRIGASRLYDLMRVLNVPVGFFFDALPPEALVDLPKAYQTTDSIIPKIDKEAEALIAAYYAIADKKIRSQVYLLAKTLGEAEGKNDEE